MSDKNRTTDGSYSSLTGFHRAVPIILAAVGAFIAICFITESTGSLGVGMTTVLRGLFSYGAYAIPALIFIHAIFYAHDLHEGCILSRAIFSLITVLIIASIEYAAVYWSGEPIFDPVGFYTLGTTGGFVGSILAFGIIKVFGPIGLIVISIAVVAIYITFFFAKSSSAFSRAVLSVLGVIADVGAVIERFIKGIFSSVKQARADKKEKEAKERTGELADDDFFAVDNGMEKLEISELGIKEVRCAEEMEANPTLHGTVYHKSAVKGDEPKRESAKKEERGDEYVHRTDSTKRRTVNLSYGLGEDILSENTKAADVMKDIIIEADADEVTGDRRRDTDSAEAVFTRDFDPFDFATGEREAARLSSKAAPREEKRGISEMTTPISELTEEDVLAARRRAAFEMRKKYLIENSRGTQRKAEAPAKEETVSASAPVKETVTELPKTESVPEEKVAPVIEDVSEVRPTEPVKTEPTPAVETKETCEPAFRMREGGKTVAFNIARETPVSRVPTIESETVTMTYGKPDSHSVDDAAATEIARRVAASNPAYTRSFNAMGTYTVIKDDEPEKAPEATASEESRAEAVSESYVNTASSVRDSAASESCVNTESESGVEVARESVNGSEAVYRRVAGFTSVINEYSTTVPEREERREQIFKPYTPPTAEIPEVRANEAATLRVERTMMSPTVEVEKHEAVEESSENISFVSRDERDATEAEVPGNGVQSHLPEDKDEVVMPEYGEIGEAEEKVGSDAAAIFSFEDGGDADGEVGETVSSDVSAIFSFDDDEDEETEAVGDDVDEIFGEDDAEVEEIPPEEQNPEVIKMREQFPFLNSEVRSEPTRPEPEIEVAEAEDTEAFDVEDNGDGADADEDEPPFEVDEDEDDALAGLVPIEEAEKEPAKPKKPSYENYVFPPLDLLTRSEDSENSENIQEEIQDNADRLIDTLASFGVTASIKGVDRGPRITRYEVVPAKGVKVSSMLGLSDDIALNLAAESIRIEAPIPGKSAVGMEIPNKKSSMVRLRELLETEDFINSRSKTTVCMGKDVAGQPIIADVAKMPHALVAGATGMGKSVCMNSLIISILYKARPDEVKFIMIDPKQVEFTMYNGIPHLLVPVVTDVKQAAGTLMWAVEEMERRYDMLSKNCVKNIDGYNEKVAAHPEIGERMHRIVIVIDEFAELIMQVKNPVESLVIRIAQLARAAGIHLIIGTQKPVKEVITGLIKSNIPTKMSCKVVSQRDAMLIFDQAGAEKLLDKGDMLVAFSNSLKPQRVQSAFVSDGEVEAIMNYLKQYGNGADYDESVMEDIKRAADRCTKKNGGSDYDDGDEDESSGEGYLNDKQFLDAVDVAVSMRKISTSLLQRKVSIGYGKAAKFIDVMESMGIVSEPNGQKPRDVLITKEEWREKLARTMYD